MGVPPIVEQPKPMDVTAAAWALRVTLPRVEYGGNCNIALLPVLRLDGTYTSVVDSYLRIAQTELSPPGVLDLDALVRRCSLIRGIGGFRQVRFGASSGKIRNGNKGMRLLRHTGDSFIMKLRKKKVLKLSGRRPIFKLAGPPYKIGVWSSFCASVEPTIIVKNAEYDKREGSPTQPNARPPKHLLWNLHPNYMEGKHVRAYEQCKIATCRKNRRNLV
ncbi:MAG: hypothetical protein LQ338_007688 [Usnochroma carphineum]|nr:MAG: hypothetical protein LQ338_007688 [Usnochroma carphineum]